MNALREIEHDQISYLIPVSDSPGNVQIKSTSNSRSVTSNQCQKAPNDHILFNNAISYYLPDRYKPSNILSLMRCLTPYIGMQDDFWKMLFFQHLPPQIQLELRDKLSRYTVDQIAHIADIIEDNFHQPPDNRLYITDQNSGTHFLIDSGSRFSIILPKSEKSKTLTPIDYMEYEEGKKVAIYGWQELVVDLGTKQTLKWNFLIADVIRPIIGADFLTYFHLNIDFKRKILIENQFIPILHEGISTKRSCRLQPVGWMHKMLRKIFCKFSVPKFFQMMGRIRPFSSSPTIYGLAMGAEETQKIVHSSINHCLCITDSLSGLKFLIDSGAMRSLIPRMPNEKLTPLPYNRFVSANRSPVLEYGYKHLIVHLGLDEFFPWNFIITDINIPLIGADFLSHFGLSVDLKRRKLVMHLSE